MRNRYVFLLDLPLIAVAAMGAFIARWDWENYRHQPEFLIYVLTALAIKPLIFLAFGMYARYWRYASIHELAVVFIAVTASSVGMALFVTLALGTLIPQFSRIVFFNDWLLTLATAGGLRLAIRVVSESSIPGWRSKRAGTTRRILIIGAGAAGTMVAREMVRNPQLNMEPAGFLDDDPVKVGKQIGGLRVLGDTKALPEILRSKRIDSVIIAMPKASGPSVRAILDMCNAAGVKSQTLPGIFELLDGQVSINRLRTVDIEDLLRRSPVTDDGMAAAFVAGRVVLITGGGGSIGCELARQIAIARPSRLVLLGHGENSLFDAESLLRASFPGIQISTVVADIRDNDRLARIFDGVRPAIVFHAAAHKHVPLMEDNPEEAVTNNIIGTRNVVNQALRAETERFVLISTDKAVSPTSVMGATKRVAEAIVRQAAAKSGRAFVTVRFGNVLGSRGSVVNMFKKQIEQGRPITVTHPDMKRFFMTIPEAVHLVLQASGKGKGGELFVLDMGQPVKIVDLAKDLIKLSGLDEDDVPIAFTGIRPGEKLEEVLFDPSMQTIPTSHPEVLQVIGPDPCVETDLDRVIHRLEDVARKGDRRAIDFLLAQIVLDYSQHGNIPGNTLVAKASSVAQK